MRLHSSAASTELYNMASSALRRNRVTGIWRCRIARICRSLHSPLDNQKSGYPALLKHLGNVNESRFMGFYCHFRLKPALKSRYCTYALTNPSGRTPAEGSVPTGQKHASTDSAHRTEACKHRQCPQDRSMQAPTVPTGRSIFSR
ncbi:hypothetical protein AVEN_82937-1 [Araneus ventricosus]|uniref:Uncharacterized protein n=1 Tax=Araneus ventricosus TaxID=182803 RepID=A0A4Y2CV52_ARAVE|nr:hypothetical protein AVEN_82937-1 [Araneus ventricosus]